MGIMIYGILITLSMILGILIYTPYAKCALFTAGLIFQIMVIIFSVLTLLEGYFLRAKTAYVKQAKCNP
jgi:hypothetical protein